MVYLVAKIELRFRYENFYLGYGKNGFKYLYIIVVAFNFARTATSVMPEDNILRQYFICENANATKFFSTCRKNCSNSTIASDKLTGSYFLSRNYSQLGRHMFFVKSLNIMCFLFAICFYDVRKLFTV